MFVDAGNQFRAGREPDPRVVDKFEVAQNDVSPDDLRMIGLRGTVCPGADGGGSGRSYEFKSLVQLCQRRRHLGKGGRREAGRH
jgi:hypothetical protein